jgi:quercetin dioxygenase-like cupin family protein
MSSLDRPLSGTPLRFTLSDECTRSRDPDTIAKSGRNARTLIKDGGLRVTLVALAAGGEIPEHHAEGPICIQVLEGSIRLRVGDDEHLLDTGSLISLSQAVPHSVSSDEGTSFLLTVALPTRTG